MVWKQDLAKLKKELPDTGGQLSPPLKPKPKPLEVRDLNDEDAFFLEAMGGPAPRSPQPAIAAPAPRVSERAVPDGSFQAEISDLKGLKPLTSHPVLIPPSPQVSPATEALSVRSEPAPDASPAPEPPVELSPDMGSDLGKAPIRIQLAAGMALEVDASLDLRHHSIPDALGRLRDRVEDGALMGWRTLHVVLGEDEALHTAMSDFLIAGEVPKIRRYAQAPIPMGGAQAWVLYY